MLYSLIYKNEPIGILEVSGQEVCLTLNDNLELIQIPWEWERKYEDGQREYSHKEAMEWIKERVVPYGRCNIHEIMEAYGMEEYNELDMFIGAKGYFNNDGYRIAKVAALI